MQSAGSNKALEFLNAGSIDFGSTAGSAALVARINGNPIKSIYVYSRPGRLFEEINVNLSRPRDRGSQLFDNFKRHVLTALDRSLDRSVPDRDSRSRVGESMWW